MTDDAGFFHFRTKIKSPSGSISKWLGAKGSTQADGWWKALYDVTNVVTMGWALRVLLHSLLSLRQVC